MKDEYRETKVVKVGNEYASAEVVSKSAGPELKGEYEETRIVNINNGSVSIEAVLEDGQDLVPDKETSKLERAIEEPELSQDIRGKLKHHIGVRNTGKPGFRRPPYNQFRDKY